MKHPLPPHGELLETPYGSLSIWEWPIEGYQYAVGVDTSSGIRESVKEGDPSAACVIEMRTCRQVAEMHGYQEPTLWGWACARLAWFYNTAALAIETQPSQHGLAAYNAADRYGYPALWMQSRLEPINGRLVERKGWTRAQGSTGLMFNRIKEALYEGNPIRSLGLLDELAELRYEEGKFKTDGHDDRVIAYGLCLMMRDQAFQKGEIKEPTPKARSIEDLYWQREEEAGTPKALTAPIYEEEWHGV